MFSRLERVIDAAVAQGCIVGVVYLVAKNGCVRLDEDDRRLA